jgi:hypothetical protein
MKTTMFRANMREFFFMLLVYFVPYKINIHIYVGGFKQVNERKIFVGYKGKFTHQTKPFRGFATVYKNITFMETSLKCINPLQ